MNVKIGDRLVKLDGLYGLSFGNITAINKNSIAVKERWVTVSPKQNPEQWHLVDNGTESRLHNLDKLIDELKIKRNSLINNLPRVNIKEGE